MIPFIIAVSLSDEQFENDIDPLFNVNDRVENFDEPFDQNIPDNINSIDTNIDSLIDAYNIMSDEKLHSSDIVEQDLPFTDADITIDSPLTQLPAKTIDTKPSPLDILDFDNQQYETNSPTPSPSCSAVLIDDVISNDNEQFTYNENIDHFHETQGEIHQETGLPDNNHGIDSVDITSPLEDDDFRNAPEPTPTLPVITYSQTYHRIFSTPIPTISSYFYPEDTPTPIDLLPSDEAPVRETLEHENYPRGDVVQQDPTPEEITLINDHEDFAPDEFADSHIVDDGNNDFDGDDYFNEPEDDIDNFNHPDDDELYFDQDEPEDEQPMMNEPPAIARMDTTSYLPAPTKSPEQTLDDADQIDQLREELEKIRNERNDVDTPPVIKHWLPHKCIACSSTTLEIHVEELTWRIFQCRLNSTTVPGYIENDVYICSFDRMPGRGLYKLEISHTDGNWLEVGTFEVSAVSWLFWAFAGVVILAAILAKPLRNYLRRRKKMKTEEEFLKMPFLESGNETRGRRKVLADDEFW